MGFSTTVMVPFRMILPVLSLRMLALWMLTLGMLTLGVFSFLLAMLAVNLRLVVFMLLFFVIWVVRLSLFA